MVIFHQKKIKGKRIEEAKRRRTMQMSADRQMCVCDRTRSLAKNGRTSLGTQRRFDRQRNTTTGHSLDASSQHSFCAIYEYNMSMCGRSPFVSCAKNNAEKIRSFSPWLHFFFYYSAPVEMQVFARIVGATHAPLLAAMLHVRPIACLPACVSRWPSYAASTFPIWLEPNCLP